MSLFEQRWKACVARGKHETGREEAAPLGFATRVLSAVAEGRSSESIALAAVWQRLTMRSLCWIGALLVICAILELPHFRDRKLLEPRIEDTVAQLVWHL